MRNILIVLLLYTPSIGFAQAGQQISLEQMRRDLAKVNKSVDATKSKIKKVRDARFLPDLYFALAEFYVEKSRYMYAIKMAENSKVPIEELDFTAEKRPKQFAIETYETLIEKFPQHPDRDRALFYRAHELRELGQAEEMIKTYSQLTREYPNSEYWPEAQIVIGDFFFEEKKDVDGALEIYKKILDRKPSAFTPLAHYKIGWAYINKTDFPKALSSFESVLLENKDVDIKQLPEIYRKTDVRRDALLALVWPYSEITPMDMRKISPSKVNPLIYFYNLSPDIASYEKVLSRLGRRLSIKLRLVEATRVYYELLRISQDLPTRMDALDKLYMNMKNSRKDWPVRGLISEIAKTLPVVRNSTQLKDAEKKKADSDWEIFARDVATRQHKRAKETRKTEDWDWTIRDYKTYLSIFPNSKYYKEILLDLAESQYSAGRSVDAGKSYETLSSLTTDPTKQREYLDSAIQSYITSIRNQSKLSKLEIAEVRAGLRDVGANYVKANPRAKSAEDIRFNIAQTYYDERNFTRAVAHFKEFIKLYPSSAKVSVAANLILDAYNQKEDYSNIVKEGKAILSNPRIRDQSLKAQVKQIVEQAEMRGVQKKAGEFGTSDYANNLMKLASKYKGSSMGDKALYEAFIAYRSKRDPKAFESGEQLLLQHQKSPYAQEVATSMGQMALVTADFKKAALYFEIFQERYSSNKDAHDLLKNAAKMRELMGDFKLAATDYQKLADWENAARQDFLAQNWTALVRSAPRATGLKGSYWEGLAQYRMRGIGPARAQLERTATASTSGFEEQEMAAHALYLLSMDALESYKKVQVRAGSEAKDVQNKAGMLKELDAKLKKVIAFGNGRWTIAALYGLAQANQEFARFIQNAPMPQGLTADQTKQYRAAIAAQANQYNQTAEGFFKQCNENAQKFEVFTRFALGCQSKGKMQVDEAQETKTMARARETTPPGVKEVQRQLYDQARDVNLLQKLSDIYARAQDYSMAELILNRALDIEPKNATLMARIGVIKLYKNELQEAKGWFEKAISEQPNNALALWGKAGLLKQFNFTAKFTPALAAAKKAGRPSGLMHPSMEKIR